MSILTFYLISWNISVHR